MDIDTGPLGHVILKVVKNGFPGRATISILLTSSRLHPPDEARDLTFGGSHVKKPEQRVVGFFLPS